MRSVKNIFVDPRSRVLYSSYYIKGLYDCFGREKFSFDIKYFKELNRKDDNNSYDSYMPFVIKYDNKLVKYIVDFHDKSLIRVNAYDWCDVYAKVNFNKEMTEKKYHEKILSIPPGFGIRIWTLWETIYFCALNYMKCNFSPLVSFKNHLCDYYWQYKRLSLDEYNSPLHMSKHERFPYVFMIARLWEHASCVKKANIERKAFIEACKIAVCNFEGGFLAFKSHPDYKNFINHIFSVPYSVNDYIKKTRKSYFVFNNTTMHHCHGWKLGEYLAMSKAMISMPIENDLPEKLVHGINVHFVNNIDEISEAVSVLLGDVEYVNNLSEGAEKYYNKYVSPASVLNYIINKEVTVPIL